MAKIKKGEWGTFSQQLMLNNYDLQEVYDNFGVNIQDEIQREEDLKLLEKAWRDPNAIIISGTKKPWRPGELVPEKYRTPIYKKRGKEKPDKSFTYNNETRLKPTFSVSLDCQSTHTYALQYVRPNYLYNEINRINKTYDINWDNCNINLGSNGEVRSTVTSTDIP